MDHFNCGYGSKTRRWCLQLSCFDIVETFIMECKHYFWCGGGGTYKMEFCSCFRVVVNITWKSFQIWINDDCSERLWFATTSSMGRHCESFNKAVPVRVTNSTVTPGGPGQVGMPTNKGNVAGAGTGNHPFCVRSFVATAISRNRFRARITHQSVRSKKLWG